MSPNRRYLTLVIFITLIPSSLSIKCDSCDGGQCDKKGCEGDYCVMSYYNPRYGQMSLLKERTLVKGCINGTLVADKVKPRCIQDEDGEDIMCICNTDKCTSSKKKIASKKIEKITCKCSPGTKGCVKNKCKGDVCVWTMNHDTEEETKGCMDLSVPLFERRAINSCMLPPMSGSMHYHALGKKKDFSTLLRTESCLCSEDNCNANKPFQLDSDLDTERCKSLVKGTIKGIKYETKETACHGEFCYKMKVSTDKFGQLDKYEAHGCATFSPEGSIDTEFGTGECEDFEGNRLKVRMCYMTKNAAAKKRLEKAVKNAANEGPAREEEEEEEGEEGEEGEEEVTLQVKETQKEKESGKESATTPNFVWMAPTESPTPDESNATMITVFVLIILCICVAGITWKFQLHRKLIRANYDTVAGG